MSPRRGRRAWYAAGFSKSLYIYDCPDIERRLCMISPQIDRAGKDRKQTVAAWACVTCAQIYRHWSIGRTAIEPAKVHLYPAKEVGRPVIFCSHSLQILSLGHLAHTPPTSIGAPSFNSYSKHENRKLCMTSWH